MEIVPLYLSHHCGVFLRLFGTYSLAVQVWQTRHAIMDIMTAIDYQPRLTDTQSFQAPAFGPGDTIRVYQKIVEKGKTRIQVFEGIVIARKHGTEAGATFTVRRVDTDGIAVEKIFPLYTPTIDRIEVVQKTKTRRAKLYFLRDRTPKQIREKLRNTVAVVRDAVTQEPSSEKTAAPEAAATETPEAAQPEEEVRAAEPEQAEESQEGSEAAPSKSSEDSA